MYYVPVTNTYYELPTTGYIPVYSTSTSRLFTEDSSSKLNNDLSKVKRELAELRDELSDLRLEKEICRLCLSSSSKRTIECDESCSICYPCIREREENYSRVSSPIHYCSICHDYVIDQEYPPPSPCSYRRITTKTIEIEKEDKLSEYLSRQLDLQRLRQRYIPEERPIWIPTAYKHDYPNRRWVTRHAHFSEP